MSLSSLTPYHALSPTTTLPNPLPLIHIYKLASTTTCGLLLTSTLWSSINSTPSLHTHLPPTLTSSSLTHSLQKLNEYLPPLIALGTGSFVWLAYYSFSIIQNLDTTEHTRSYSSFQIPFGKFSGEEIHGSNSRGLLAGLGKAPMGEDAGVSRLGGDNRELEFDVKGRSAVNFSIGAVAMAAALVVGGVIGEKVERMGMGEKVGGEGDVGVELERRIDGEVVVLKWVRTGLVGVAFGVSVWELLG